MKVFVSLFLAVFFAGCSTASRNAGLRDVAMQTFGSGANLKIHEVVYTGPPSSTLASMGTTEELSLARDLKAGATRPLDLVVWGDSSSKAASTMLRALRYPGVRELPCLRLLFMGSAQDAERVRPAVEATGAKFFFHQR